MAAQGDVMAGHERRLVRDATMSDAPGIAGVHVASWQAIYRGQLPDAFLDSLCVERRRGHWERTIAEGGVRVGVAEGPDGIDGFVSLSAARDADADAVTGELTAIYLHPETWRRGVGRRLMDWAKSAANQQGWIRLTLWVLEENRQAREFYAAMGWHPDGARKADRIGGTQIMELRYVWPARE